MKNAPQLLGGIIQRGLIFTVCVVWCLPVLGQGGAPANPLRRVAVKPARPTPKVEQPKETPKVKTVANIEERVIVEEPVVSPIPVAPRNMQVPTRQAPRRMASRARPSAFSLFPQIRQPLGYGPPPAATFETRVAGPGVPALAAEKGVVQGEVIYEGGYEGMPGELVYGDEMLDCCGGVGCFQCCCIPCPVISLEDSEVFGGVQGFTGPRNRGESGSFGFYEGFNWGTPFFCTNGAIGAQFGLRATQSSLSGTNFTDSTRNQIFLTTGLFRRVDWGLQGGIVFDYLSEDWYSSINMTQVRGEISWVYPCSHEFGFWFTARGNEQTKVSDFSGAIASVEETWRATSLFAFFYRRRFECVPGAESRIYAGFTNASDGLIGADARLPINTNWALQTDFTYLVPNEGTGTAGGGNREEGWNVAIGLVWYPGCQGFGECDYFRPLFNVAGNGSFMLDRQ